MEFTHFWNQGDAVSHTVGILLALLSLLSWALIGTRFFAQLKLNQSIEHSFEAFWNAKNIDHALSAIQEKDRSGLFIGMAKTAHQASKHALDNPHSVAGGSSASDLLTRALRNYMVHCQARLESGQTFLASVGSTSPFIGLFGTVWGIYHALVSLSGASQVVLDKVAGPVGEALIMTAAGLFVAIPAVLAYNAVNRANRLAVAYLDGFAHDLHAYFTTGSRVAPAQVA